MKINGLIILGFGVLSFSSCTTLMHQRTVGINIIADVDSALVCMKNTNECYITPVTIDFIRSKSDIELIVRKDTLIRNVTLDSRLSTAFWLGNMFNGTGVVGYAIDLTNPKRFTYPKNNYVSLSGSNKYDKSITGKTQKWIPAIKNQLNFKISIPEGNLFYLNKGHGYGNTFGFLGISEGIEYYFSDLYSINTDFGGMTDFIIPIPAPVDYEGGYDRSFATYLDLQVGRDIGAFHFDLGVQGNRTSYYERETVELYPEYIDTLKYSVKQFNAGLALSGYYKITNGFNLGLNYYPSCFSWYNKDFDLHYSHLIMFELIFKIKAYRPGKEDAAYKMKYGQ